VYSSAAERAKITKHICWHNFRHTFSTLLKANGEDVKTVQELLRHAMVKMTLEVYTQAVIPAKRTHSQRLLKALKIPKVPLIAPSLLLRIAYCSHV
jgi:integrase